MSMLALDLLQYDSYLQLLRFQFSSLKVSKNVQQIIITHT